MHQTQHLTAEGPASPAEPGSLCTANTHQGFFWSGNCGYLVKRLFLLNTSSSVSVKGSRVSTLRCDGRKYISLSLDHTDLPETPLK